MSRWIFGVMYKAVETEYDKFLDLPYLYGIMIDEKFKTKE